MGNKTVWIICHHSVPPSMGGINRHHYFAKYLTLAGYKVKIFTASKIHNTDINMADGKGACCEKECDGVVYTFVRTGDYTGNGFARVKNMLDFALGLWGAVKTFLKKDGKPDIIYASSPDIFGPFRAALIARKLKIPCIFEVRDLWPESIVAYGIRKRNDPLIKALYALEKWMYVRADRIIFTMEGGKDYLSERGLDKAVSLSKVFHINNGVDLGEFNYNKETFRAGDPVLDEDGYFKALYAGSIRHVNNVEALAEAAGILQARGRRFKLVIYGDGDRAESVQRLIGEKGIRNAVLRRRVEKRFIPGILAKADLCLLHFRDTALLRYGHSNNKLFDYLAAGKPVLSDADAAYDAVRDGGCGLSISSQTPEAIAGAIEKIMDLPKERYGAYCKNSLETARRYDYKELAKELIKIIEGLKI